MSELKASELSLEGIERMSLKNFAQDAYLNYSMSVIRDRALPSVTDGMKPVQQASTTRLSTSNPPVLWVRS